ncbi:cytochrome c family protein [Geobacter metallireducens RCH3]|uniref:Cytochrome c n=1 Tax=Geobacter metallireducens (strain ATCC 53774 / DSM 7210 / GS-15) TaxID=269799 RepID=Q39UH7_GEOMG|nr:hypothetical protein [Geobacter metallireducens]ABB32097.1 cytochrome c [Geobacter metallireducens GS-15]EHP88716.1 cytochrome c family protein [Geobacter metallireducens RCH3]
MMVKTDNLFPVLLFLIVVFFDTGAGFGAQGPKFTEGGNKHNLSFSNTGVNYKATNASDPRGKQICIFCHTPHNAKPQTVLWNRNDTTQTFGHYSSNTLAIHTDPAAKTSSDYKSEPNGSSRLCLSCHDGVTALGAVLNGDAIEVNNNVNTVMSGTHVFNRTKITNSHHPVSFVYNASVRDRLNVLEGPGNSYQLPTNAKIRLDRENRMQCITCHDPHQTQYNDPSTPFWVLDGTSATNAHDSVCTNCHNFTNNP